MTQAEQYVSLHEHLENKELDSSYQAAMYILFSSKGMTKGILPYLSRHGIEFMPFIEEVERDGSDAAMVELAYNLFSWQEHKPPTPHDLATIGYPYIEIALEAIFIASGLHQVVIEYDEASSPVLSISTAKQERARRSHEGMKSFFESQF